MSVLDLPGRLDDILAAIREIEAFAAGKTFDDYMAEPMLRRAVERDVEIISEASRYIPERLKAKYSSIPWRKVAGIGNVLRHGYKLIDDHEMWGYRDSRSSTAQGHDRNHAARGRYRNRR